MTYSLKDQQLSIQKKREQNLYDKVLENTFVQMLLSRFSLKSSFFQTFIQNKSRQEIPICCLCFKYRNESFFKRLYQNIGFVIKGQLKNNFQKQGIFSVKIMKNMVKNMAQKMERFSQKIKVEIKKDMCKDATSKQHQ
ncbi:hypothetical protein TTHERM_000257229 (macronuclear) [Tetrahymena thermophila SB210]|uniref:Uncharacterized protein n=1 Tax=Tetrahymena thermophila (strain SB210) TaxID=312017 RepID=W7XB44_TETTS|nr:hypothetical protein TTHERM_000257229 [Tetrahymena thermophila SB210]EWS73638.1 hypothetical protein TTHERM_000257229 [Tetrahymena thermophila SB210]|eukprot:XP_012653868.1 hypothetical protein TTHERM_000257229 [Tetrahymena thermophila SB210]